MLSRAIITEYVSMLIPPSVSLTFDKRTKDINSKRYYFNMYPKRNVNHYFNHFRGILVLWSLSPSFSNSFPSERIFIPVLYTTMSWTSCFIQDTVNELLEGWFFISFYRYSNAWLFLFAGWRCKRMDIIRLNLWTVIHDLHSA